MKIAVINGPNINLLGTREPDKYGNLTLEDINRRLEERARDMGISLSFSQSNYEGGVVEAIQDAMADCEGIIINAAAYTHTSVAVRDAILACGIPAVEVHLTEPRARDEFRHKSYLAGACVGAVAGFGWRSYLLALMWFAERLKEEMV